MDFGGSALAKVLFYYGFEYDDASKIVCPFHDDVNASMKIDLGSGSFYCFGCHISGDALLFVKRIEKIDDDLEACMKLVKVLRSKRTKKIVAKVVVKSKTQSKQALIVASDYYTGLRKVDWHKEDASEKEYMQKRGLEPATLNKCGAKLTYNKAYPIIFPMLDNGEFRGWVCRTTTSTVEKKRKYLYNTGFSRATTLCGSYHSNTVFVVEGYIDMLKLMQFGVKNVVALLGWKITGNQVEKLKEAGVTRVVSALDTDTCGEKGSKYLEKFFDVVRFSYPAGVKDAGDLNRRLFNEALTKTMKEISKWD